MGKVVIANLRKRLGLNQTEFGNLFGVHPITLKEWERGALNSDHYQIALMNEFIKSARSKEVQETLSG